MSVSDRPRCQRRIVSSSRSRPGFVPGDDLAQLGVQRRSPTACPRRRARAARRTARLALAPVVDDELVHDVGERELDRAHRAVGHDERAALDPLRPQQRRGLRQARGLDDDVGAAHARLPIVGRDHRLAEIARQPRARTRRGSPARRECTRISSKSKRWSSRRTFQYAVPRAPMWPSTRLSARARWRAPMRGHRAGAHVGDAGRVDHRERDARSRGSKRLSSPISDGRPALVVVDVVADDLDAGERERRDVAAQHVEVAVDRRRRPGTRCTRGSITVSPRPCAARPASTAARISSSVSASAATSGPLR